jgi:hypothetical protein
MGTVAFWTISSKRAASVGSGSARGGSGDLQAPHLPVSLRCFAGMRFF